jgi:uncharacterized protein (TIGR02453 family)
MSPTASRPRPAAKKSERFEGWPKPAIDFFRGLRKDNSKAYFERQREVYLAAVKQPTEEFFAALQRELGPGWEVKVFRINRDLRFTKDKRPYQEHTSGYLAAANRASGLYVQVSDEGMYLAAGAHEMDAGQLKRYRDGVAGKEGEKLARIVAALERDGYAVTEPRLKRVPAGYPPDHPRGELLRRTGMMAGRSWKPGPWMHSGEALDRVRGAWRDAKALTAWLEAQVGPSTTPVRGR